MVCTAKVMSLFKEFVHLAEEPDCVVSRANCGCPPALAVPREWCSGTGDAWAAADQFKCVSLPACLPFLDPVFEESRPRCSLAVLSCGSQFRRLAARHVHACGHCSLLLRLFPSLIVSLEVMSPKALTCPGRGDEPFL